MDPVRRTSRLAVLLLILLSAGPGLLAQADASLERAVATLIEAGGFSSTVSTIERDGTLLGLPPSQLVAPVLTGPNTLTRSQRETLVLALLRHHATARQATRAALAAELTARLETITDWSLTAAAVNLAAEHGELTRIRLAGVAARVLALLETSDSSRTAPPEYAGYEQAAIAVARAAPEVSGESPSPVLAEMLRAAARLARSPRVVEALRSGARSLLSGD